MRSLLNTRGETMIEVLVALTVLIVGILGSLRLFEVAVVSTQLTKERVIATNLAREGIEAVRTIRDTNWLRYAGERRKCWNNSNIANCDGLNPIVNQGHYTIAFNTSNYRWELVNQATPLSLVDGVDSSYRLQIDPATRLYNHISGAPEEDNSIYFREVTTEYLNANQTPATDTTANLLRVTAKVEWYDRGKLSDVTLTTILTDYLGRKNHD